MQNAERMESTGANRNPADRVVRFIDPSSEYVYWRDNYTNRPYVNGGSSFSDYGPAYEYGIHSAATFSNRSFDEIEPDMAGDWDTVRGTSSLTWERARNASRDSWERVRQSR